MFIMTATNLFLALTILTAFCAWYLSTQDSKQKDRIENLGNINKKLTTEVEKLSQINNSIAIENSKLTNHNIILTAEAKILIAEVKKLTVVSNELVAKIDTRTEAQSLENALSGELDLIFDNPLKDSDWLIMRFGTFTSNNPVKWFKKEDPPVFISIGDKDLVPFRVVGDKLKVNLTIYDLNGNWIAEIVNNFWRRNPNNTSKFNYDKTGFEIVDNRGFIALNVDLISNKEIKCQGYLISRDRGQLFIGGTKGFSTHPIPKTIGEVEKYFEQAQVKQMFKYTGDHWIGKRN